jgi:hypothetical protein
MATYAVLQKLPPEALAIGHEWQLWVAREAQETARTPTWNQNDSGRAQGPAGASAAC